MTPTVLALIGVGAIAAAVAAAFLVSGRRSARAERDAAEQRRLLAGLASDAAASRALAAQSERSVQGLREAVEKRLGSFEKTIDERIQSSQEVLGRSLATMQQGGAEANRLVQTVSEHLGRVVEFSQQMAGLGAEVSRLQDLFKSPKVRGGLGERFLEESLRQVLPPSGFEMQKRFSGGEVVDAAIRVGERWVVVDSKFPLENFRRASELDSEIERKNARAQFFRDVRRHVDAIAGKYIRPAEGTLDFALMYVPAEAVYAEIVAEAGDGGVMQTALAKKVIPVSPLHFYTYLATVSLGLKGMEIEKRAHEILDRLAELKRGVSKVEDPLGKLGSHLDNAKKQYEETSKQVSRFVEKLRDIAEAPEIPAQAPLPLHLSPPESE